MARQAGPTNMVFTVGLRLWTVIGSLLILAFVAFFVYDFAVNGPKAAHMQPIVEDAFRRIPPLPKARGSDYQVTVKPGSVLVGESYTALFTYPQILAHYNTVLTDQGWRFVREKHLTDWGKDLGGMVATYCKDGLQADLQYAGERANYGWTYGVDIGWGKAADVCPPA